MPTLVPNSATASAKIMENYRLASPVEPGNQLETFTDSQGNVNVVTVADGDVYLFSPAKSDGAGWQQIDLPGLGRSASATGGLLQDQSIVFTRTTSNKLFYWLADADGKWGPPLTIDATATGKGKISATSIGGSVYLTIFDRPVDNFNNYRILQFATLPDNTGVLAYSQVFSGTINSESVQVLNISGEIVEIYLITPKPAAFPADGFDQTWSNVGMNNLAPNPGPQSSDSKYVGQVSMWYPKSSLNTSAYPLGDVVQDSFSQPTEGWVFAQIESDRDSDGTALVKTNPWELSWDDHGTNCETDGALYNPNMNKAEAAFCGMGMATTSSSPGNAESYSAPGPPTRNYWNATDGNYTILPSSCLSYIWRDQNSKAKDGDAVLFNVNIDPDDKCKYFTDNCFVGNFNNGYSQQPPNWLNGYVLNKTGYPSHFSTVPSGQTSPSQTVEAGTDMELMSFSVRSDGTIVSFGSYAGGISGLEGVGTNWEALYRNPTPEGKELQFTQIDSAIGCNSLAQCFVLDSSGSLFVINQIPGTDSVTYSDLFPIADQISTFSVCVSGEGTVEVYAITVTGKLVRLFQAGDTDIWTTSFVNVDEGALQKVSSYTTQFVFTNDQGTPLVGREVSILADAPLGLNINGQTCAVNQTTPVKVRTNMAGELNCIAICTNLSTVPLAAWGPKMEQANACRIDPSSGVQTYFSAVNGTDISDAANVDGSPVFPDLSTSDADQLASGLQAMMGSIDDDSDQDALWSLKLGKRFEFRRLNAVEAAQRRTELQAMSLPSLHVDFGTIFASIRHGVTEIAEILRDGAEWVIHYTLEGLDYLWQGVLNEARQVMDLVSATFESVKASAIDVFEWIADEVGFLFEWDDILNTASVISAQFKMVLETVPTAMQDVGAWLEENISELEAKADQYFEDLAKQLEGKFEHGASVGTVYEATPSSPVQSDTSSINLVQNALMNGAGDAEAYGVGVVPSSYGFSVSQEVSDSISSIIRQLQTACEDFRGSDGFQKALDDFADIAARPEQFVERSINALLEIVKAILIDALEAGRIIIGILVQALVDLVETLISFLEAEWEIPLVTKLYHSLTGQPLTIVDMVSLMLAIPATAVYKAIYDEAPLTDDQTKAIVAIAEKSPNHEVAIENSLDDKWQDIKEIWGPTYTSFYVVFGVVESLVGTGLEAVTDCYKPTATGAGIKSDTPWAKAVSSAALVDNWVSTLRQFPAISPGSSTQWDWWGYLVEVFNPIIDTGFFFWERNIDEEKTPLLDAPVEAAEAKSWLQRRKANLAKNEGEIGTIAVTAYGALHFGLACFFLNKNLEENSHGDGQVDSDDDSNGPIWMSGAATLIDAFGQIAKVLREHLLLPPLVVASMEAIGYEGATPKQAQWAAFSILAAENTIGGLASLVLEAVATIDEAGENDEHLAELASYLRIN